MRINFTVGNAPHVVISKENAPRLLALPAPAFFYLFSRNRTGEIDYFDLCGIKGVYPHPRLPNGGGCRGTLRIHAT